MKLLVLVLPIVALTVVFTLIWRGKPSADMSRADRKELSERRLFMAELGDKAVEHSMLGDNFAVIVSGMLTDFRRKIPR